MTAPAVDYERLLANEGLAPIDKPLAPRRTAKLSDAVRGRMVRREEVADPARAAAVDTWLGWARDVLRTHKFDTPWQRAVWSQYAQGRRLVEIAARLQASKRAVTRALERVEKWAPPAPIDNPWRRGHCPPLAARAGGVRAMLLRTNRRVTVRICMLALQCADRDKLREIFGNDQHLSRLVPQENDMGTDQPKRAPLVHLYNVIALRRTIDVRNPVKGARQRDQFLNTEGRPHAGGIDVEVDQKRADGTTFTSVITIPWDAIKQAERAAAE